MSFDLDNISNKQQKFIDSAISAATNSTMKFQIGSVVVRKGKIMSMGFNQERNRYHDPKGAVNGCSFHAEMHALKGCVQREGRVLQV